MCDYMASKMNEQTPAGINELKQCYAEIDRLKTENDLLKGLHGYVEKKNVELREILEKLKKLGLEATNLIAHLKDQHGFNDVEEEIQNKLNEVFGYQGDW